jgi:O-antigen ligase
MGLVFSRSRAGLALGALGLAVSVSVFGRRIAGTYVRGALRSVILVAAVVVVLVGALPVLSRFVAEDPIADDRWQTARRSWTVAEMYLPFGSGIGSFETVYTPLQPVDENAAYRINKAHNDYLQALLEGGVLWAAAIAATLVAFVQRWRALARERVEVTPFDAIRTGAGIGIGLLLLHSLVDYNLQIPANAMVFALLWGLFLHEDHR